jgi:hypothetical protein
METCSKMRREADIAIVGLVLGLIHGKLRYPPHIPPLPTTLRPQEIIKKWDYFGGK